MVEVMDIIWYEVNCVGFVFGEVCILCVGLCFVGFFGIRCIICLYCIFGVY